MVVSNRLDGGLVTRSINSTKMEIFDEDDELVVVWRAQSFLGFVIFAVSPFKHALDAVFELNGVTLKREGQEICTEAMDERKHVLE